MVWRYYDWECAQCQYVHPDMIEVPTGVDVPRIAQLNCPCCGKDCTHERLMSAPAVYTYDRPYAPVVYGGKFDTQGYRKPPPLPTLPVDKDFDKARDMIHSKEAKERWKARFDVMQQNKAKQARAEAMKKHPTMDIRNTPLPGDPPKD